MSRLNDLTGQVFSDWTVIERDNSKKRTSWFCRCACGEIKSVCSSNLKSGTSTNCGCRGKNISKTDYSNSRIGFLQYLKDVEPNAHGRRLLVLCLGCGNEHIISASNYMKGGSFASCGCYKNHALSIGKRRDLKRLRFGRLKVLRYTRSTENRKPVWECLCNCGNQIETTTQNLIRGDTRSCGCLQLEILSRYNEERWKPN